MNRKSFLKKVIHKLAKKPMLGSFYILMDQSNEPRLYYSVLDNGMNHPKLWKKIVDHIFKDVSLAEKSSLKEATYGAPRGRVDWTGTLDDIGEPIIEGDGDFLLEGTPECAKYEPLIKSTFGVPTRRVKTDWQTSEVYITIKDELNKVIEAIKKHKPDIKTTEIT